MADSNIEKLKAAYRAWHESKAASGAVWLELMSDDVDFRSSGSPDHPALAFGTNRRSKQEVVGYFTSLAAEWSMVHFTTETYVGEGDLIAVFSRCAYTHKKTGKSFEIRIAHLWKFEAGRAVEITEIFDSARVVSAATA